MSSQATASDSYPIHENEQDRLASLKNYEILDTSRAKPYDNLTELVADHFDVPIVLLSLMDEDRQWFKSTYGYGDSETERECALCNYTIVSEDLFVVNDAQNNERFIDNKLVTGPPYVRFYAGYPLFGEEGLPLGTLCLIDTEPRQFSNNEATILKLYAGQAETLLDFHLKNQELASKNEVLSDTRNKLESMIDQKETLLDEVHHRVKNNLQTIMSFLRLQSNEVQQVEARKALTESKQQIESVSLIHERLHKSGDQMVINFNDYCRDLISSIFGAQALPEKRINYELKVEVEEIDVKYALPLGLIITEAVMNSFEHAFSGDDEGTISIEMTTDPKYFQLKISDDGSGLPENISSEENESFGLRLIRIIVTDQLNGQLKFESEEGASLIITIPRRNDS